MASSHFKPPLLSPCPKSHRPARPGTPWRHKQGEPLRQKVGQVLPRSVESPDETPGSALAVRVERGHLALDEPDDVVEVLDGIGGRLLGGLVDAAAVALLEDVECLEVLAADGLEGHCGVAECHPDVAMSEQVHRAGEAHGV